MFTHLHLHTDYSLLDGMNKIHNVADKIKSLGMNSVAITDHGNMFGVLRFYNEMKKQNIKPIIGVEAYVVPNRTVKSKNEKRYHLILLAENNEGYKNLLKIVSDSFINGFYYKPRTDYEMLKKYHKGIIALSACLQGEIPQAIINNNNPEDVVEKYLNIFGKNNFFLEVQYHGFKDERKVIEKMKDLSNKFDIPLIATNDAHYTNKSDLEAHRVLMGIQMHKTLKELDERESERGITHDTYRESYIKSEQEMLQTFKQFGLEEAVENTQMIANRCNVDIDTSVYHLPKFSVSDNKEYMRKEVFKNIKRIYGDNEQAFKRAEYELSVIEQMGFTDYFLIVQDFINWAKEHKIPVGPGRGSAAGSIVSYALGITQIDPLKYNLIFERFLNPSRISMPDIDVDFGDKDREKVVEYVKQKYGKDKVSLIATFGKMESRMVIRDVARVLGFDYNEADKIAKAVPPGLKLRYAVHPELIEKDGKKRDDLPPVPQKLKEFINNPKYKKLFEIAVTLEGVNRNFSTHAAGVVIADKPLTDYLPLAVDKDKNVISQFDKEDVEHMGLLKMDFLGLKNLTIIKDAVELINKRHGLNLDFNNLLNYIDLDDKKVFNMFAKGDTTGIFQFESAGMKDLLRKIKPKSIEDLSVAAALYRPGPLGGGATEMYVKRRNKEEKIEYLHPALKSILKDTYGVIVYQEQVMQIANKIAGFTLAESDTLRKAIGKKKKDIMEKMHSKFIQGASSTVGIDIADKLWKLIEQFGSYGFNKAHSVSYGTIAYITGYLKYHYPVEYFTSLINSYITNTSKLRIFVRATKKHGIKVLPPDINKSGTYSTIEDNNTIRLGFLSIKNVGEKIKDIVSEGEHFESFEDFVVKKKPNKKIIESLIKAGAFDSFNPNRKYLLKEYADNKKMSLYLFDIQKENISFTNREKFDYEREVFGFVVSSKEKFMSTKMQNELSRRFTLPSAIKRSENNSDKWISTAGFIDDFEIKTSKKGNKYAEIYLTDDVEEVRIIYTNNVNDDLYFDRNKIYGVDGILKDNVIIAHQVVPIENYQRLPEPSYLKYQNNNENNNRYYSYNYTANKNSSKDKGNKNIILTISTPAGYNFFNIMGDEIKSLISKYSADKGKQVKIYLKDKGYMINLKYKIPANKEKEFRRKLINLYAVFAEKQNKNKSNVLLDI